MQEKRIEFIDFAKGFAITTIMIYHYCQLLPYSGLFKQAIQLGGTGVHLFVFLSGFGLMLSSRKPLMDFYKRRLLKILLPYYFLVTFLFVLNTFIPIDSSHSLYAYLGHIFLYKMFDNSIVTSYGGQFWYISMIVQLYLVFPFLQKLMDKIGFKFFIGITFAISLIYWIVIYFTGLSEFRVWNSSFLDFLWEFALGMVCASLYKSRKFQFWKIRWPILLIVAILGISLMGLLAIRFGNIGRAFDKIPAFFGYTALAILLFALCTNLFKPISFFFDQVGSFSYSLFLTHVFVLQLSTYICPKLLPHYNYSILFALALVPTSISICIFLRKNDK